MAGSLLHPHRCAARHYVYRRLHRRNVQKCPALSLARVSRPLLRSHVRKDRPRRTVIGFEKARHVEVSSALGFISTLSPTRDAFDAAIHSLVGGSAMICFALAFVPLFTYDEEESKEQMEPDDLETIKWSVAGAVSCFPYLNWTSWLLIAFDSELPLPYYFLSALYLIPSLQSGFDLQPFSIFMLVLGVMHMQVERVAQTEPAILGTIVDERPQLPSAFQQLSQTIGEQLKTLVSNTSANGVGNQEKDDASSISQMVDRALVEKDRELQDAKEISNIEKQFWDEKFDNKND